MTQRKQFGLCYVISSCSALPVWVTIQFALPFYLSGIFGYIFLTLFCWRQQRLDVSFLEGVRKDNSRFGRWDILASIYWLLVSAWPVCKKIQVVCFSASSLFTFLVSLFFHRSLFLLFPPHGAAAWTSLDLTQCLLKISSSFPGKAKRRTKYLSFSSQFWAGEIGP